MPQTPDVAAQEAAHPESKADEPFDPLLVEAANALDPSVSDPPLQLSDPGTVASKSTAPLLTAGTVIAGRYRLDQRLGEGGMGEVWAATHAITRRRVAMKFLKGPAAKRSEMHQRFLREARAVSLVRHPSVVEVLDVFELEVGVPVMVMDLLVGETLGAKLARDGPLPVGRVVALILPAIEALEAAHARGIVHRDLKPDNIFLQAAESGQVIVKVLDFGIAKLTAKEGDEAETGPLTGTGSVLGTPWYMAPEQLSGEKDIDPRADVWALGVILYECVSGRRPVHGANVAQLVTRMLRDGIVPIEERVPDIAPELARLVGRMLAREREDRPRDLAEVRQVLVRHAQAVASELPLAMGRSDITPADCDARPARWDTGVAHSVPRWQRTSRSFGVSRIPVALVGVTAVVVVTWAVVHSTSHRMTPMAAESPTPLTTSLASRATPAPEPSSIDVASSSKSRFRPAETSQPNGFGVPRRPHAIADAGMRAGKDPAGLTSVSVHPGPSLQPIPDGGGLFEVVPF